MREPLRIRATAAARRIELAEHRQIHNAHHHIAIRFERDQIGPQRIAAHVIPGAIDRIDNPAPPAAGLRARAFFAQNAVVRETPRSTCRAIIRSHSRSACVTGDLSGLVSATMFGWILQRQLGRFLRGFHRHFQFSRPGSQA